MACGVAVVGKQNSLSKTFIETAELGILADERTPQKYATLVFELLNENARLQQIAQSARLHVIKNFSREVAAAEMEAALIEAIKNRKSDQGTKQRLQAFSILVESLGNIGKNYNRMLYDLLFSRSIRFKLNHWAHRLLKKDSG